MAIDTAEKRKSVSGVMGVPLIPGVTPNSSKDSEWRAEAGWSYSGIAVGLPVFGMGCWSAGEVYNPGFQKGEVYNPGFQKGQNYLPGFQKGQAVCN